MTNKILAFDEGTKIEIMAPVVRAEKGSHVDLLNDLRSKGYTRVRINGEVRDLSEDIKLEKNKKDTIEVVVDRVVVRPSERSRIFESIEASTKLADGRVLFNVIGGEEILMSENYACVDCNFSMPPLETRMFSFNSPWGACDECNGLGIKKKVSEDLLIPDKKKSINEGAIVALTVDQNIQYTEVATVADYYDIDLDLPVEKLSREKLDIILYGSPDIMNFNYQSRNGNTRTKTDFYEGIITNLERRYLETTAGWIREWIEGFMIEMECPSCHGRRLKDNILSVYINKKNIYDMTALSIADLYKFMQNLKLNEEEKKISELLVKEICNRLEFLNNVGLGYLNLARAAGTLSGGEAQRIRLATQIGSKLSGVLYVLDEPSIGLHQRDNDRLIESMKEMRDLGNTLIVVEHDMDTMRAADYIVDVGPGAGTEGGYIMAAGTPEEVMKNKNSLTGKYLTGELKIDVPKKRRKGNGEFLEVRGAKEHNLKNINVKFPLGEFICVTGVSGSGKSTLINDILFNALTKKIYKSKVVVGDCKEVRGMDNVDKVVHITQDPIGRTPRSNPATYVGVFDDIRDVFAGMKEAKIRGYGKNRFSFNVKGGRCEACWGDGVKRIEMNFLPDVYVPCEVCHGTRYNRETLDVKFKGKDISEVLHLRVNEALEFFDNIPKVKNKLQVMYDVGLSYIELGQSAPTLSGGEAGRVKLAKELQKKATGKSVFILDEPTTGLHSDDIKKLLVILRCSCRRAAAQ